MHRCFWRQWQDIGNGIVGQFVNIARIYDGQLSDVPPHERNTGEIG